MASAGTGSAQVGLASSLDGAAVVTTFAKLDRIKLLGSLGLGVAF
jgi:hypothetical protein